MAIWFWSPHFALCSGNRRLCASAWKQWCDQKLIFICLCPHYKHCSKQDSLVARKKVKLIKWRENICSLSLWFLIQSVWESQPKLMLYIGFWAHFTLNVTFIVHFICFTLFKCFEAFMESFGSFDFEILHSDLTVWVLNLAVKRWFLQILYFKLVWVELLVPGGGERESGLL